MTPKCAGCGKPVKDGQPRYAGSEPKRSWHYDCWVEKGDGLIHDIVVKLPEARQRIRDSMTELRKKLGDLK